MRTRRWEAWEARGWDVRIFGCIQMHSKCIQASAAVEICGSSAGTPPDGELCAVVYVACAFRLLTLNRPFAAVNVTALLGRVTLHGMVST